MYCISPHLNMFAFNRSRVLANHSVSKQKPSPSSLYLKLVVFSLWGPLHQKLYRHNIRDIDHLHCSAVAQP